MRRKPRIDRNHTEIVAALRQLGAHVTSLAACGGGVPDLVVGFAGRTILLEVKDGEKAPSDRQLTPAQMHWLAIWNGGPVYVVESVDEAIGAVTGRWDHIQR